MFDRLYETIIRVAVMFIAFPVHEFAHAYTAHLLGDDTAKKQGRLTLNPIKHMNLFGTVLMVFVGVGWAKPVPVNPNNFKNRKAGMAVTSFAGPVSNLILAYLSVIIWRVLFFYDFFGSDFVRMIFEVGIILNIGLAVFNMLPVPPLDGSRLITLVFPDKIYFKVMKYERYIFFALIIVVYSGMLDGILLYLRENVLIFMMNISGWVDFLFR